jgi:PAS domain S-box-containing protein
MTAEITKVLLVDDSEDDFELTREMLSHIDGKPLRLDWVATYGEALQLCAENRHDVYLIDYHLNEHDGIELMQDAVQRGCRGPMILLTGRAGRQIDLEAMTLGAADYLDKSQLNTNLLERSIRYALAQKNSEARLVWRATEAELMYRTTAIAADRLSLGRALEQSISEVCRSLRFAFGQAWLVDERGNKAVVARIWCPAAQVSPGDSERRTVETELGRAGCLVQKTIESGMSQWCTSIPLDDRSPLHDACERAGLKGLLCVPVKAEESVAGVLEFLSIEELSSSRDWLKLMENVAEQIGRILERHHAEETRRQNEERLRQSQKLEAVGMLASGVTHEFNNLMQAVQGYARFAMEGLPNDDRRYQDMEQILAAAEQASTLTRQLLSFCRKQPVERELLDPNQAVQEILTMLRPVIGNQIEIDFCGGVDVQPLLVDRSMFQQVLMNLCINARDAMPDGGKLTISTNTLVIDEANRECYPELVPGPHLRLMVADTGCGMTPEVQQRMFDPFFTTKEVGEGTGLGMATVYGIVQQHRGAIRVDSAPQQGTALSVLLPLSDIGNGKPHVVSDEPTTAAKMLVNDNARLVETQVQRRGEDLRQANGHLEDEDSQRPQASGPLADTTRDKARLIEVLEATPDFVGFADTQQVVRYVNPAGRLLVGMQPDEDISKYNILDFMAKSVHRLVIDEVIPYTIEHGVWTGNVAFAARDGTEIPVWMVAIAHKNQDGELTGHSTISRDLRPLLAAQQERETLHRQLRVAARQAGMAEVANGVLHNVGNVLNSANVSTQLLAERFRANHLQDLSKAVALLGDHADDLTAFVRDDRQGKHLPMFLREVAEQLQRDRQQGLKELTSLQENIAHIKEIVQMQQTYGRMSGICESLNVADVLEEALQLDAGSFARHSVRIVRNYQDVPCVSLEKHQLLQILVNLISNARHALRDSQAAEKTLTLRVGMTKHQSIEIAVADNGMGISSDNLSRIFCHGFTTKKDGHGYGLHHSALAAKDINGTLAAHSEGPGRGATFTLTLPLTDRDSADSRQTADLYGSQQPEPLYGTLAR